MKFGIFDIFLTCTHIPNFIKIRPVSVKLLHADGHTDRQTDAPKKTKFSTVMNINSRLTVYCKCRLLHIYSVCMSTLIFSRTPSAILRSVEW